MLLDSVDGEHRGLSESSEFVCHTGLVKKGLGCHQRIARRAEDAYISSINFRSASGISGRPLRLMPVPTTRADAQIFISEAR